ncbi:PA3496 family putative envelope integrity protein [Halioglobus sp. Uisw_031]|jgi:hypothetical protein|uniref:PA3496 family putative envelope integrity protein n=1 Tax=Halioglobus sp. Uisw_031 TaxID=3230977 RepID=UPI0039E84CEA
MGERDLESSTSESMDGGYEPGADDISDDMLRGIAPLSSDKQQLVQRRRLAEQRLEEKRLRDELGDYDLQLDYH